MAVQVFWEARQQTNSSSRDIKSRRLRALRFHKVHPKTEIEFGNYFETKNSKLKEKMKESEGYVFAARVDGKSGRKESDLQSFYINPLYRLLGLEKEVGIKHVFIYSSFLPI